VRDRSSRVDDSVKIKRASPAQPKIIRVIENRIGVGKLLRRLRQIVVHRPERAA
jgi:hypothetical protein